MLVLFVRLPSLPAHEGAWADVSRPCGADLTEVRQLTERYRLLASMDNRIRRWARGRG